MSDTLKREREWERAENVESGKRQAEGGDDGPQTTDHGAKVAAGGFPAAAGCHRAIKLAQGSGLGL